MITSINHQAAVANIVLKGTELEWFKYSISKLKRIALSGQTNTDDDETVMVHDAEITQQEGITHRLPSSQSVLLPCSDGGVW